MSNYSSTSIKIKYKYYMFKLNKEKNKITLIIKANSKKEIMNTSKQIKIENDIILIKLEKTKWTPTTKIPANMLSGPIKVLFSFYTINIKRSFKHEYITLFYKYYNHNPIDNIDQIL